MADTIQIPMTPIQFAAAQVKLTNSDAVLHTESQNSGFVQTKLIDFTYSYDGAQTTIEITARHGLVAHMASLDEIKQHIQELLA